MDNADKLIKDIYEFIGDPVDYAELVGSPVPSSYGICYVYEEPGDILLAQAAEMLAQQQNKINELLKKAATTVDAEPVRHGQWTNGTLGTECSCCGSLLPIVWCPDDENGEYCIEIDETLFCPNCGVKMDLE